MKQEVRIKRAYEPPKKEDGFRVLVDRIWPRGIRKQDLHVRMWAKDIAPTTQLRQWFAHDPKRWPEFRKRYLTELREPAARKRIAQVIDAVKDSSAVTLIYSAKDEAHNQAVVLQGVLERKLRRGAP
ncbi:MAG TPA: DUF488 family protein [Candidatus Baltobacteraceae bacterium]|nr:DUF488 family protein [Candidatus Baltobacteraceae bacterium]